jgi:beta-phosphoglucomutase-like phosphatase (HAD superfamily)
MASHWKSTPSYWCKFCASYVRDTPIERKNHETSAKHQNNIQRSLRELHKTKEREDRDKQRAKDEVARLNGLVGGAKQARSGSGNIIGARTVGASAGPSTDAAAQRKAHAEQLAAMGVELPDELKKEVTGVGEWQTVSTRVVEAGEGSPGTSLADILKQESVKKERNDGVVKGVHKRFADEDEVALAEEEGRKRKAAWGSRLKTYPGKQEEDVDQEDLDALLSGVTAKKRQASGTNEDASVDQVSKIEEDEHSEHKSADAFLPGVKPEDGDAIESRITAPPVPVFKKRKSKK